MFQYVKLTKIIETTKFISLKMRVKHPMEVLKNQCLKRSLYSSIRLIRMPS